MEWTRTKNQETDVGYSETYQGSGDVKIEGIDYKELGLYLSLTHTDAELQQKGLKEVCPRRRSNRGLRPTITGRGMDENEEARNGRWIFRNVSRISNEKKREMLTEAIRTVLTVLLNTHAYEFAGEIRKQTSGGPIGMEITGVVAQVFMVWWDRRLRERLDVINIQLPLHKRYVDDTNLAAQKTEIGARYDGERLQFTEESRIEDEGLQDDERTMLLIQSVANSIHHSIRHTIDFPSNHEDRKVPMLDLKMWRQTQERQTRILYEHYEKEMTTKSVIHRRSALPEQVKRTVLTQELLRILLHCSEHIPWKTTCKHVNNFMKKLQYSGYDQTFRHDITRSGLHAYKTIKERAEAGIRPINRPKEWKREERMKEKENKEQSWYRKDGYDSVLFVPATPGSKLRKMYQKEIKKSGIRIRVVERSGETVKSMLQRSNPFRATNCGREDCFICTTTGVGNCNAENLTYKISCDDEECIREYKGESTFNGYKRGKEQIAGLRGRTEKSGLWKHCQTDHAGVMQTFSMKVTGTFKDDSMLRQITEAVQIENTDQNALINTRAEWNMTRVPRMNIQAT